MDDSLALFRDICESRFLEYCGMICFLNKQDQLRDKIVNRGYKMSNYFPNYDQFDYEPKTNVVEHGQEYLNNNHKPSKYALPIKTILKVGGKLSRQSSINSFNNLEPIRIPENNEDADSLNVSNAKSSSDYADHLDDNQIGLKLEKKSYLNSFKSLDADSIDQTNYVNALELEYRKARCYIKNLFVNVAEQAFDKKIRKSSNFGHTRKPRERYV